ncbi:hypothetical protein A176_001233 [Myxococcus hansupus]|uniref:Uncharacterized protein n=1 Tax=Pseudomyxococcus hansupus TaxID=1297742 RepID=A0A0H4WLQ1_9BACT|nr:hypothetical protein A176_001233 [Myxococcus hansupus]
MHPLASVLGPLTGSDRNHIRGTECSGDEERGRSGPSFRVPETPILRGSPVSRVASSQRHACGVPDTLPA